MKRIRQDAIKKLILSEKIGTQEELALRLNELGHRATQATISRDIRQMGLRKAQTLNGELIYVLPGERGDLSEGGYGRILREGFTSISMAEGLLVIKTASGMAMAVAAAIDNLDFRDIVGTIAGDDTIFLAVNSKDGAEKIMRKVEDIIANVR